MYEHTFIHVPSRSSACCTIASTRALAIFSSSSLWNIIIACTFPGIVLFNKCLGISGSTELTVSNMANERCNQTGRVEILPRCGH